MHSLRSMDTSERLHRVKIILEGLHEISRSRRTLL